MFFRPSLNQPCPCGSEKKYKLCCQGKLSKELENYYGLLQQEKKIKDKLLSWTAEHYPPEKLNLFTNYYCGQDFASIKDNFNEFSHFLDWFFLEARDESENNKILQMIIEKDSNLFSEPELMILTEWDKNTQCGIFEVIRTQPEKHLLKIKDRLNKQEYEIFDIKGSQVLVRGDVFVARVQQIFNQYYFSGALANVPRLRLNEFMDHFQQEFNQLKKINQKLSYENFMNQNSQRFYNYTTTPPKIFSILGEEAKFCTAIYNINSNDNFKAIIDFFAKDKRFIINNEEWSKTNSLISADIAIKGPSDFPDGEGGLITFAQLIDKKGNKINTAGSINIHNDLLELFSMSESIFKSIKKELEVNFNTFLSLKKEKIKTIEEIQAEKDKLTEEDLENDAEEKQSVSKSSPQNKALSKLFLTNYYKEWCDQKIPLFNNKTPREMIKTKECREKVEELLLTFENEDLHHQRSGDWNGVDSVKIIRKELGLK